MTIWILALVLFAALAAIGYNQGAIRVGFSLIGLVVSSLLAAPTSRLVTPAVRGLLGSFSVHDPLLIWAISPVVAFLILLTIFKIAGLAVHKQVEVFYKYKAGDLRLALWERLNKRVGACLGIVNGLAYLLLISLVVYVISYCTTQMDINQSGPKLVRYVNRAGQDVVKVGLAPAVRAIDPVPPSYYEAADIVGMIYHNPLTQGRLSRYPSFLILSERPEFQDLANDKDFLEMIDRQAPVVEILDNPKTKAILNNPELLNSIWSLVGGDLHDLHDYLQTGQSVKYGNEPILGRWTFDVAASVIALKHSKPNFSASQLQLFRRALIASFGKAVLTAMPDHAAILKDVVKIKPGTPIKPDMLNDLQKYSGQWQNSDGKYTITLSDLSAKDMPGVIEKGRLKIDGEWAPVVFSPEE